MNWKEKYILWKYSFRKYPDLIKVNWWWNYSPPPPPGPGEKEIEFISKKNSIKIDIILWLSLLK